jgi:deoxyribodipyrimidine photo-lyase
MHNRARLLVASHLTRREEIDWRDGARHFLDLLLDGDIANNSGNWQWIAGTSNDTRPNRVFNPLRQARRFDPDGDYVRRYVPELAHITGPPSTSPGCWSRPSAAVSTIPSRLRPARSAEASFRCADQPPTKPRTRSVPNPARNPASRPAARAMGVLSLRQTPSISLIT